MYARCGICKLQQPSLKSLVKHRLTKHPRIVRCVLCFRRFPSMIDLSAHYFLRHTKSRIIKQLLLSSIPRKLTHPLRWIKVKKTETPRRNRPITPEKIEKLYVQGNIHISYGNKDIIVELSSDDEESLEVSIDNVPTQPNNVKIVRNRRRNNADNITHLNALFCDRNSNVTLEAVKSNEKLVVYPQNRKNKKPVKTRSRKSKSYKHFCLEFVKPEGSKSLNDKTGEFYSCNCSKEVEIESVKEEESTILTSDTESSSDNGKYSFYPILDKKLYCNVCGNGYRTKSKLMEHRKTHNFHCRTCGTYYSTQRQLTNHVKNHVFVYCCHICKVQFLQKGSLLNHLNAHQESDIVKSVLELEQNYSHYLIDYSSDSYATSINNITAFLSSNDYKYNSNYYKVRCQLCYLEFFKCEFPEHLKMHYFFKNSNFYFKRQLDYKQN